MIGIPRNLFMAPTYLPVGDHKNIYIYLSVQSISPAIGYTLYREDEQGRVRSFSKGFFNN